ncbi:MAG: hypothetical protein AAGJ92_09400 [Pseudomonadota bacterium]
MTQSVLVSYIALGLIGAMILGWILRWIYGTFAQSRRSGPDALEALTTRASTAEDKEAALARKLAETETELRAELREKTAELDAAMDGLRHARQQAADWQAAYQNAVAGRDGA